MAPSSPEKIFRAMLAHHFEVNQSALALQLFFVSVTAVTRLS